MGCLQRILREHETTAARSFSPKPPLRLGRRNCLWFRGRFFLLATGGFRLFRALVAGGFSGLLLAFLGYATLRGRRLGFCGFGFRRFGLFLLPLVSTRGRRCFRRRSSALFRRVFSLFFLRWCRRRFRVISAALHPCIFRGRGSARRLRRFGCCPAASVLPFIFLGSAFRYLRRRSTGGARRRRTWRSLGATGILFIASGRRALWCG